MTKDLTTGKIMPILVNFTVPLVLGNLFQLTYNAVDSIIVGRFVGKEALAAVGICNPISTLMILFLNGLCMGASILMGIQYGAKDYKTLHRQISTTMLSGMIFSFILTLFCDLCHTDPAYAPGRSGNYEYDEAVSADYFSGTDVYVPVQFLFQYLKGTGRQCIAVVFSHYQCSIEYFR